MLTILPLYDYDIENKQTFIANQDGQDIGKVTINITTKNIKIIDFIIFGYNNYDCLSFENKQLVYAMIKTVALYGLNRGILLLESGVKPLYNMLIQFGFSFINDKMSIDGSKLIKSCECCND